MRQFALKNMMRILLGFIIIFSYMLQAQQRQNFILSECNFIPSENSLTLYFTYRIPYSRIIFEKNENNYIASFRLNIEVFDSAGKFLTRGMATKKVTVKSYEESISRNIFTEGLMKFNVDHTSLKVIPLFTDLMTNSEIKQPPIEVISINRESDFLPPLIINNKLISCDEKNISRLANYGGTVPFNKESYDIIIPSKDTAISAVNCVILNNSDTIFNSVLNEGLVKSITISECENGVTFNTNEGDQVFKLFKIKNISSMLEEGTLTIFLSSGEKFSKENIFKKEVRWFNKPITLFNQELAARTLKYVEDDETISALIKADEDKFMHELLKVWKKSDPTKETRYNELLEQYYSRVDYAVKSFSTITGKQGWDTDRGAIYIQYGSPTEIKRSSNGQGKVVETWIYENPANRFNFIDKTGTGEFVILK